MFNAVKIVFKLRASKSVNLKPFLSRFKSVNDVGPAPDTAPLSARYRVYVRVIILGLHDPSEEFREL